MKLLGSSKNKTTKDEADGNLSHLVITKMILVQCNVLNNSYLKKLRVLYTFVPNKSFDQFLEISLTSTTFLKTFI